MGEASITVFLASLSLYIWGGEVINDIVRSAMRLLGKHIARATKHFTLTLSEGLPLISVNASRIEQVVK